jgi:hypothetical protein
VIKGSILNNVVCPNCNLDLKAWIAAYRELQTMQFIHQVLSSYIPCRSFRIERFSDCPGCNQTLEIIVSTHIEGEWSAEVKKFGKAAPGKAPKKISRKRKYAVVDEDPQSEWVRCSICGALTYPEDVKRIKTDQWVCRNCWKWA